MENVFHADRLRLYKGPGMPGQIEEPPPPIEIEGRPEYIVARILSSKVSRGRLLYKVDWEGYEPDETWYPARNFKNSPHRLREFHEQNPSAPGPPINLDKWLSAFLDDRTAEEDDNDDAPKRKGTVRRIQRHKR